MKKLVILSSLALGLLLAGCPNKDETATGASPSSAVSAAVGDNVASASPSTAP